MNENSSSSFQRTKLGDVTTFITGKLNSNAAVENGQYPFFTCSQDVFRTNTYSFNTECVLLGGNNANGIYPLKYFNGKFDVYQRTYVIRSKDENRLDNKYLYYNLHQKLELLKSISTGAATKFLTKTILNDLEIDLPPIQTQKKIAAILSAYDDLIENNNRRIKILEEMAQALYREWFVEFRFPGHEDVKMVEVDGRIVPEGWEIKNLNDIAEITYGFPFKSKLFTNEIIGKPVIRIRNIKDSYSETYTPEVPNSKYIVDNGDILVGMDGDFHIGKWSGGEAYLNQRVVRFRPKYSYSDYFVYLSLQEPISHYDRTITGTTVAHLSAKDINSINLIIPNDILLENVNLIFDQFFKLEIDLRLKNKILQQTRELLLPRLIEGEIDVSDLDVAIQKIEISS